MILKSFSLHTIEKNPTVDLLNNKYSELLKTVYPVKLQHDVYHINTNGETVQAKSRKQSPKITKVIEETFDDYLKKGIVRYVSNWKLFKALKKEGKLLATQS